MKTIDLNTFLSGLVIKHNDTEVTEKSDSNISHDHTVKFSVANIELFKKDGNYYYDYIPQRKHHMIGNIRLESSVPAHLYFYTNDICYSANQLDKFLVCSADYTQFKMRVIFSSPPKDTDTFAITTTLYSFNDHDLEVLIPNNILVDTNVVYYDGIVSSKNTTIYNSNGRVVYDINKN